MLSVKDFYNKYHKSFDRTRYSVWRAVRDFIEVIPPGSTVLEAGCGNGKNLEYMNEKDLITMGVDFSDKLVDICKEKHLNVSVSDIRELPFEDNTFDYVLSIAVIHHLEKESDRIKAINEMLRVCKTGGKVLISVWSLKQEPESRRKFVSGPNLVKWLDTYRYYYIYDDDNLQNLLLGYDVGNIMWDRGNYFIVLNA